ncbi:tRNA (32-2'-O)-methyltransferase regulator THADA isoform X2 [Prorops nasuta]|uniref:tRNA (32-2'-O)-methyltransferase regulator THADA isoform X2 n=1 Tax=Prorops nasuta TaxID=863751 RepID=UPI0034CDCFE9
MEVENIIKSLNELRVAKKCGDLDHDEMLKNKDSKWRDILCYDVFEGYMKHNNQEVRLCALELLVEYKKSTLRFLSQELYLIQIFLIHNLGERMEYVPLVKKCLNRVRDSLAVMRRQLTQEEKSRKHAIKSKIHEENSEAINNSYQHSDEIKRGIKYYIDFLIALRNLCIDNLYIDATYSRRKTSLQILCLMKNILNQDFIDLYWENKQTDKIFQSMLLDTYEPNKEMAFQIILCLPEGLLNLDVEKRLYEMFNVAFALGNSIRPIDSITAAYILKTCILSSKMYNLINTHFKTGYISAREITLEIKVLQVIFVLLKKLEEVLILAKQNMVVAVTKHSIYGYLFCVRSLLNECNLTSTKVPDLWKKIFTELIKVCTDLSDAVSIIVNNSSPEGHLPMDLTPHRIGEADCEKDIVTPQMVLLCSWRTVKEVSLLFGLLTSKVLIIDCSRINVFLTDDEVIKIGEHLVTLLCETKHRGAFEQAHVGFFQLCTHLWRLNIEKLHQLPIIWLHNILLTIIGFSENSKLCATRRSAGVPFMIQALVASQPNIQNNNITSTSAFHSVMNILLRFTELEECEDNKKLTKKIKSIIYVETCFSGCEFLYSEIENEIDDDINEVNLNIIEIKVHALNILRALYRHSQLGDFVKPYIADGLIAAFRNYDGETWAERNAATLLFSALIIRIFGVQRTKDHVNLTVDNKMTGRIFFEKYPILLSYMLDELQTFISIDDGFMKPSVQSILLLLSRLYLSHSFEGADISWKINEFIILVSQCAKCPIYKTRELAARALVPLLTKENTYYIVRELFDLINAKNNMCDSLNAIHGYLLQILEIVRNLESIKSEISKSDFSNFITNTTWILENLQINKKGLSCFPLASVYVDVIHEIMKIDYDMMEFKNLQDILSIIQQHVRNSGSLKKSPGQEMYKISVTHFILFARKNLNSKKLQNQIEIPVDIYLNILEDCEAEIQIIGWSTVSENSLCVIHKYNPDLQDAIFNYLFTCLSDIDRNKKELDIPRGICEVVLNKLRVYSTKSDYCERSSYLRLLGKAFVALKLVFKEETSMELAEDIYNNFCDHFWICALDEEDVRSSVFHVMYDLSFICKNTNEEAHCILDWWTTLLKLLIDDNHEIRQKASQIICKIEPTNELMCFKITVEKFFEIFYKVLKSCPGLMCAALFYWSISLSDDAEYEMDETDVFNKCRNYDCFEPIQMAKMCIQQLELIIRDYSIDNALSSNILRWLNKHLNLHLPENTTFRSVITEYKSHIAFLSEKLEDVLDPMYKDKLMQITIYKKLIFLLGQQDDERDVTIPPLK